MLLYVAAASLAREHYREKPLSLSWLITPTAVGGGVCLYEDTLVDIPAVVFVGELLAIYLSLTTKRTTTTSIAAAVSVLDNCYLTLLELLSLKALLS
jgi:hypothetical protein